MARWRFQCLVPAAAGALLLVAVTAGAQSDPPGAEPEVVTAFSQTGDEYLLGLGVGFEPHRVLAYGSVLSFDPLGFNLGVGYDNDSLLTVVLYRQHSPGRLPYLDVDDRQGGLLLLEYTPPSPELRLELENELYVGQVDLRHSGRQFTLYDEATATLDLLADYRNRVSLVADLSTLQLVHRPAGAYGLGLAAPMRFLDRAFIVEPRLLHSGLTQETPALVRDLVGYRFGDFSVRRLFGLLGGIRSDTSGTTALVLNLEARLHFLQAAGVPILDGIFVAAFADGGLFWGAPRDVATAGDFTVGGALGIDWLSVSVAVKAGYNHADAGFVWGIEFRSFQ